MRQIRIGAICFALAASVFAGASIAGAEELLPESTTTESAPPTEPESTTESAPTTPESSGIYEPEASLLVGCSANWICIYSSTEYNNPYVGIECGVSGAFGMGGNRFSATNRCGNKTNWLRVSGSAIACMNPGGNRPNPGAFNEVFVAAEYGALC